MEDKIKMSLPKKQWKVINSEEASKREIKLIKVDDETTLLSIDIACIPLDMTIPEYIETICKTGIVLLFNPNNKPVEF